MRKREGNNMMGFVEDEIKPITTLIDKQIEMSKVGGDLGTLSYLQALQNMNLMNQAMMKKLMGEGTSEFKKEDIKDIVKEIVISIMKELGAEVK